MPRHVLFTTLTSCEGQSEPARPRPRQHHGRPPAKSGKPGTIRRRVAAPMGQVPLRIARKIRRCQFEACPLSRLEPSQKPKPASNVPARILLYISNCTISFVLCIIILDAGRRWSLSFLFLVMLLRSRPHIGLHCRSLSTSVSRHLRPSAPSSTISSARLVYLRNTQSLSSNSTLR